MAHESFEDVEIAQLLNEHFVSIKVDKEERPDIDSIYMNVCQAFTGGGGWPMSVFITPEQKPFFAGTYFNKLMFAGLLIKIKGVWDSNRKEILQSGDEVIQLLRNITEQKGAVSGHLLTKALEQFKSAFDSTYGGFGEAPKFPVPHNLLFLMDFYEKKKDRTALEMAEKTLISMYKGGIFDHIGFGFSRYSTDPYFLVPHFEKMLYDNALLMMSYITAYRITGKNIYKETATKTAQYVMREMTSQEGGFFSAQDADSDGIEGKYYVFDMEEIEELLGADAESFCKYYGITKDGNFEGNNILNLLHNNIFDNKYEKYFPALYEYRKRRTKLHLDDKILTSWNGLMIAAFSLLYRISGEEIYLKTAVRAYHFIETHLSDGDHLFVSYRMSRNDAKAFLDDYAFYIFALLSLYDATYEEEYLNKAGSLIDKTIHDFYDRDNGGFFLYGTESEQLILRPKETYDGALPSGNSVMSYNLVKYSQITGEGSFEKVCRTQLGFMSGRADSYPIGHAFYLLALSRYLNPPPHIVCAVEDGCSELPIYADVQIIKGGNEEYPVVDHKTTYYVCKDKRCLPPTHDLGGVL